VKDSKATLATLDREHKAGRIRPALLLNEKREVVQIGDEAADNGWHLDTDVPNAFVEAIERDQTSLQGAAALFLAHQGIPLLSIGYRTSSWEHFILLPLVGQTVRKFLRWSLDTGHLLRAQLNGESGTLGFQLPLSNLFDVRAALALADKHAPGAVMGHEGLAIQLAAYDELQERIQENATAGRPDLPVVISTVELPEVVGTQMLLMRAIREDLSH
jgi:hypothetical protein